MAIASQSPKPVAAVKAVRLFPNYVGTYAGTVVIKKGLDKGLVFSQTVTNTSENRTTGVITFVGTNYFPNGTTLSFAGQTTVNARARMWPTPSTRPRIPRARRKTSGSSPASSQKAPTPTCSTAAHSTTRLRGSVRYR